MGTEIVHAGGKVRLWVDMQVALPERAAAVGDDAAQICVFCSEATRSVSNPVTGSTSREDQEKNMIHKKSVSNMLRV